MDGSIPHRPAARQPSRRALPSAGRNAAPCSRERPVAEISLVLVMLVAVVLSEAITTALPFAIPLPLVQIALGALLAAVVDVAVPLAPDIFFLLFIPPLLFLDGWRIPKRGLFKDAATILELALGLVVFTVVGIGFFIQWLIPAVPLAVAFALAAILSPTDPIAVSALTSRVPGPKRLMHILEGESLLNDASGLVCMRFALAAALTASSCCELSLGGPGRHQYRRWAHVGGGEGQIMAVAALRGEHGRTHPDQP